MELDNKSPQIVCNFLDLNLNMMQLVRKKNASEEKVIYPGNQTCWEETSSEHKSRKAKFKHVREKQRSCISWRKGIIFSVYA